MLYTAAVVKVYLTVYIASHPKVRRTVTVLSVRILEWFVRFVQRNASTILVRNAEAKRPLDRPSVDARIILKWML